jgi:hypothetical protein
MASTANEHNQRRAVMPVAPCGRPNKATASTRAPRAHTSGLTRVFYPFPRLVYDGLAEGLPTIGSVGRSFARGHCRPAEARARAFRFADSRARQAHCPATRGDRPEVQSQSYRTLAPPCSVSKKTPFDAAIDKARQNLDGCGGQPLVHPGEVR